MAETGKTVRIILKDGYEKIYQNALADTEKEGWIDVYRLKAGPGSGRESIAGYWMRELTGWEYIEEK